MARTTIVGVFENTHEAQQAVRELRNAGFRDDQIGVVAHNKDRVGHETATVTEGQSHAGEGALAGLATGAGMGGCGAWASLRVSYRQSVPPSRVVSWARYCRVPPQPQRQEAWQGR